MISFLIILFIFKLYGEANLFVLMFIFSLQILLVKALLKKHKVVMITDSPTIGYKFESAYVLPVHIWL